MSHAGYVTPNGQVVRTDRFFFVFFLVLSTALSALNLLLSIAHGALTLHVKTDMSDAAGHDAAEHDGFVVHRTRRSHIENLCHH